MRRLDQCRICSRIFRLAQSKIRLVALNDTQSNLIDLDVAFYMYTIQSFNSAHVNAALRTGLISGMVY